MFIRKFQKNDEKAIRAISCRTAFLGIPYKEIFDDDDVLGETLTGPFTKYEPGSCFVAEDNGRVKGYIIGAKDIKALKKKIFNSTIPGLIFKIIVKGSLLKKTNILFVCRALKSYIKGEFKAPCFDKDYPATLHINIDAEARGKKVGSGLIHTFLSYLKESHIRGVHFGTMSDEAAEFFKKCGFTLLHTGIRTYLKAYTGKTLNYYIFGMKIG